MKENCKSHVFLPFARQNRFSGATFREKISPNKLLRGSDFMRQLFIFGQVFNKPKDQWNIFHDSRTDEKWARHNALTVKTREAKETKSPGENPFGQPRKRKCHQLKTISPR
jgi:hypothetical protein